MDNSIKIIIIIFIIVVVYKLFRAKTPLEEIMSCDLQECTIYYNNTHAYIDTPNTHYMFKHDSTTLPIIKKYHPI